MAVTGHGYIFLRKVKDIFARWKITLYIREVIRTQNTNIMTRSNIEIIIKDLAKQAINGYRQNYTSMWDAEQLGEGYWNERNEDEIERDTRAGVTLDDYMTWCGEALELIRMSEQEEA